MPNPTPLSPEETETETDTLPENEKAETETQSESESEQSEEEQEQTDDELNPENNPPPPPAPVPDPNKRLREQAREVQPLLHRVKSAETRIDQLTKTEPPTETELRQEFPDWDTANSQTQRVYRELLSQRKKTAAIENRMLDTIEQQAWDKDLASVVEKNPKLKGQEEAFKAYAYKPAHRNVPLDVLANSFLFTLDQSPPPPPPAPRRSGSALERGTGGPKPSDKPGEISSDEAAVIRKNDPRRYRTLVKQGKIKGDI